LTEGWAARAHDLAHLMSTPTREALKMSTINTPVTFREAIERTAALLLYVATAMTVAGGAVAMCAKPFGF
jgi:hypothetical protein